MPTQIYAPFSGNQSFGTLTVTGGVVQTPPAPAAGRGFVVQLGKKTALDLNTVAAIDDLHDAGLRFHSLRHYEDHR